MDSRPPARQRHSTRLAFHASRIVIDVGVLVVLGSMSMPFVTAAAGDRSAIASDALPTLLLVLPIFAITMIPDHTRPLPAPLGWLSLVLAVAALPYAAVKYLDAGNVANTIGGEVATGAKLLVFGTLVVVAGIVIGLARTVLRLPSGGINPEPSGARRSAPISRRRAAAGAAAAMPPASAPARGQARRPVPDEAFPAAHAAQPEVRTRPAPQPRPEPATTTNPPQQPRREPTVGRPEPQPGRVRQPQPRPKPPAPQTPIPDPAKPERAGDPRRVSPPRARRPVINPRPDHDALPKPKHPTGELPLPHPDPDDQDL